MYQPYPSSSQPAEPPWPAAPAPVLTAVKLMYAGAAVSTVTLIISLGLIPAIKAALRKANPSLTAAQVGDVNTLITLAMLFGLVVIAGLALIGLWLWMARATSRGKNWARILSTVLFGLATLELLSALEVIGKNGVAPALTAGLTWLSGLAAVWMLWRPASSAFFKSARRCGRGRPHKSRALSRAGRSGSRGQLESDLTGLQYEQGLDAYRCPAQ